MFMMTSESKKKNKIKKQETKWYLKLPDLGFGVGGLPRGAALGGGLWWGSWGQYLESRAASTDASSGEPPETNMINEIFSQLFIFKFKSQKAPFCYINNKKKMQSSITQGNY